MEIKRKKSVYTLLLFFALIITVAIISMGSITNTNALEENKESFSNESEQVHIVVNKNWKLTGSVDSISDSELNYFWSNFEEYGIRIELYKNDQIVYFEEIKGKSEYYQIDFGNWPKYSNGEKCIYTIKEIIPSQIASYNYYYTEFEKIIVDTYTESINMNENEDQYIFNICNSLRTIISGSGDTEPKRIYCNIYKEWSGDGNNIKFRPQNVHIKFNVKLGNSNLINRDYMHSSTGINYVDRVVFQYYEYQGKPEFIIKEDEVPGYKADYKVNWKNGSDIVDIIITNTYINKQTIEGEKIWIGDNETTRPEEVTVWLLRDGERYLKTKTSAINNWKYKFEDVSMLENGKLDSGYEDGHIFEYSVEEEVVPRYKVSYDGYNIINTFIEEKDIEVTKIWDDDNNKSGKRPENITLQVKNGEEVVEEKVVSSNDNWKHIFKLPKYDEIGNEIEYTVDEKSTSKYYEKRVEGYTIINKFIYEELVNTSDINVLVYMVVFLIAAMGIIIQMIFIRKNKIYKE